MCMMLWPWLWQFQFFLKKFTCLIEKCPQRIHMGSIRCGDGHAMVSPGPFFRSNCPGLGFPFLDSFMYARLAPTSTWADAIDHRRSVTLYATAMDVPFQTVVAVPMAVLCPTISGTVLRETPTQFTGRWRGAQL